jgi:hypothetical protein
MIRLELPANNAHNPVDRPYCDDRIARAFKCRLKIGDLLHSIHALMLEMGNLI